MNLDWKKLAEDLTKIFTENKENPNEQAICQILGAHCTADISLALDELSLEQAFQTFQVLDAECATDVLSKLDAEHTEYILEHLKSHEVTKLVESLPAREAAIVLNEASDQRVEEVLENSTSEISDIEHRLNYPKGSAGRLMTAEFITLSRTTTIAQALEYVKSTDPEVDVPSDLYVVENSYRNRPSRLLGVISIRSLLMCPPENLVEDVMTKDVVSVQATTSEEDVASMLAKYKFSTMPVTDAKGRLMGVIPVDDLMAAVTNRFRQLYTKAVGTDAEVMEKLSPGQAAKVRVPWLLGTMAIELGAGLIIAHYDGILQKVILLASFMPVISAVSGNVGLQAAAITVRALDGGGQKKNLWKALKKESATSFIMAIICGLVLGAVGAIWAKHIPFGIVITVAIFCSMITAGMMGTVIPIVSKRFGFDPATTAGPFETAFQDVIGFAVFLGLATLLQDWM